jgi:hypothetical protein
VGGLGRGGLDAALVDERADEAVEGEREGDGLEGGEEREGEGREEGPELLVRDGGEADGDDGAAGGVAEGAAVDADEGGEFVKRDDGGDEDGEEDARDALESFREGVDKLSAGE